MSAVASRSSTDRPGAIEPAAPAPNRARAPWYRRGLDTASAYLPLLLMAALALGTWWLVKNTPLFEAARAPAPLHHVADYTMTRFMVQHFGADGAMRVQIEGDLLRHYPDTDTVEIDNPRIRAIGVDGRVTLASARQALSNRDGSDVLLTGAAHIEREATAKAAAIDFRGESLHYFKYTERVQSDQPVVVTQGSTEISAAAMAYDNLARVVDLVGQVRAVFAAPPGARR